jgi:phosphoglycolate phosphatase
MALQFKTAVFDLDGTLLDTSEGVLSSVRYAIEQFHLEPIPDEELRKFIGPPIQDSYARVYGLQGEKLAEVAMTFRSHYKDVDLLKARPYDGIYDVFQNLLDAGIRPAIATYKRQDYATRLLEHFGFNRYTDIMYGSDFEGKLRKNDIIRNAIRGAGAEPGEAVMIGDSDNDAEGAQKLGVKFIGVTYGFGFCSEEDVDQYPNIGTAENTAGISALII